MVISLEFVAMQQLVRVTALCSYDLSQVTGHTKILAKFFVFSFRQQLWILI